MPTVPAAAIERRRCLRDFRKEDRQWDSTSGGNFDGELDDPSADGTPTPWDRQLTTP